METEKPDAPLQVLPPAYAPFLPVLEQLSPAMQRVLRGQLLEFERLARSIGRPRMAEQGEFEGLSGLTTRGDISQLIQSELLLRTEAPLEFLRRLAEKESVYLEKVYSDPGATAVYRAAVSVGPGLLGHGRLVAVAALFFIARVAMQRNARFHWCFLPRADGALWFDELSVNTIKRFLKAASYREMNLADLDESRAVWERFQPQKLPDREREIADWAVGASGARAGPGEPAGVEAAADALVLDLQPPRLGEARVAQLRVRQHGRARGRTEIVFPDERVCLSALRDPFQPARPVALLDAGAGRRPPQEGWEPRYFVATSHAKLVRVQAGLLILVDHQKDKAFKKWLIALPEDAKIAGVACDGRLLSIVLQAGAEAGGALVYRQFHLGDRSFHLVAGRSKIVSSAHLFRSQPEHALPPLRGDASVLELCSSSGQAFRLELGEDGGMDFGMLYDEPRTLHAAGACRVVRTEERGLRGFRVLKGARLIDAYEQTEEERGGRHLRLVYSPEERGLAYSVLPDRWEVPRSSRSPSPQGWCDDHRLSLQLEPHEVLLSAKPTTMRISARIWSDARYGGDGTIRFVRVEAGERTNRQAAVNLGEDALAVVDVKFGDNGCWAVAIGADGAPSELLHYRFRKKTSRHECTRFDLDKLSDEAPVVPAETFRD